jgi:Glycosyltransferase family 87
MPEPASRKPATVKSKSFQIIVRVALAAAALYFFASRASLLKVYATGRDSIQYWAAGRLLIQHGNPYDVNAVFDLEAKQGPIGNQPGDMAARRQHVPRIPPWSLFLTLPLGLVDVYWGWLLWMAVSIASLVIAMRLCRKMFVRDGDSGSLLVLVGYTFAPVLACIATGQIGLLLLLGIVLFLRFESDRPFVAGAALFLPFAKPHLLSLFWIAFALWIVARKKWAVARGFAAALLTATCVVLLFDPAIFQHYHEQLNSASIGGEFIPSLAGVLRALFMRRAFWAQFVPVILASIWCVWFCLRNRPRWDWRDQGLTVMVVSVLVTPYAWITDEVVLLPAILQAAVYVYAARDRAVLKTGFAVTIFAGLNALLLLMVVSKVPITSAAYFWSSLVWCGWYLYGRSGTHGNRAINGTLPRG